MTTLKSRWRGLTHFQLEQCGRKQVAAFCKLNSIPVPKITAIDDVDWRVGTCAYYRPDEGIKICISLCAKPCGDAWGKAWSWPGNDTDRTAYGVLCHELGHHVDCLSGTHKGAYFSDYSDKIKCRAKGEKGITSYAETSTEEWFAEAFRLFVTNPPLLNAIRPWTYHAIRQDWEPLKCTDWEETLGIDVPDRIISNLKKKVRVSL